MRTKGMTLDEIRAETEIKRAVITRSAIYMSGERFDVLQASRLLHIDTKGSYQVLISMVKDGLLTSASHKGQRNWFCRPSPDYLRQSWRAHSNEEILGDIYDELGNL